MSKICKCMFWLDIFISYIFLYRESREKVGEKFWQGKGKIGIWLEFSYSYWAYAYSETVFLEKKSEFDVWFSE